MHDYIRRRIPPPLSRIIGAEDILQEVWLAAFGRPASLPASRAEDINRWLWRIAEQRLLNVIRDARRLKRGGGKHFEYAGHRRTTSYLDLFARVTSGRRTPSSEGAAREAVHAIQVAIGALPDEYRQAVLLFHIQGCSRADVAESMQKSEAAIASLLYRGRRMLRDTLGQAASFFSDVGHMPQ